MALLPSSLLALRSNPQIARIPTFLSSFCVLVGVVWLMLLPLDGYSRKTYISENALLPGQVRTYFSGSEHNVFRAYRQEVALVGNESEMIISERLASILTSGGLKVARQKYQYKTSGGNISGENVYAVLEGPRADATEALVLIGAFKNIDGRLNQSGVALVLTLARYFRRWSLWSKDIIFLIPGDSVAGVNAWVTAYHNNHDPKLVESLPMKSGSLQGAVAIDYPAGVRGHRFEKIQIIYEGVNGQLPNLDLINTAISIAGTQLGVGVALQKNGVKTDTYKERFSIISRGMLNQGLGFSSGPHSAFMPYHVDAITLQAIGDGWHDEIILGKMVESLFRSLNNLLEHFHQSFFFYLLMHTHRFVSIGTYLPSAMLLAMNFTISSMALWIQSGKPRTGPLGNRSTNQYSFTTDKKNDKTVIIRQDDASAAVLTKKLTVSERHLLLPILFITFTHFLGLLPLYIFNHITETTLTSIFILFTALNILISQLSAFCLARILKADDQVYKLIQCFSMLLLGIFLSALATLNFSLSFLVGILSVPLSLSRPNEGQPMKSLRNTILLHIISPPTVLLVLCIASGHSFISLLLGASIEWQISGLWTQIVIWLVWWPAWFSSVSVIASPIMSVI